MSAAPRTIAIIQARMSSSRLPGKVLMPLDGRPMLIFMIERLRRARTLDEIVVATSNETSDDPLAEILGSHGIPCHRGSLDDVLDRFTRAARSFGAEHAVRLTGDCPLIDVDLVDAVVRRLRSASVDYVSNIAPPTYPDGLDVEAFTLNALERAWKETSGEFHREHVTTYLRTDAFSVRNIESSFDLSSVRWTVDHPDDLELVRKLVASVPDPIAADRFDFLRAADCAAATLPKNAHRRNEALLNVAPIQD